MKEFIAEIEKQAKKQIALDEIVHDTKSKEASEINNEGIDSQLNYLLQSGFSLEDIKTEILDRQGEFEDD